MFTPQDLKQIADHGLAPERVEEQVENFRRGFPFLKVVRAASPGDGARTTFRKGSFASNLITSLFLYYIFINISHCAFSLQAN